MKGKVVFVGVILCLLLAVLWPSRESARFKEMDVRKHSVYQTCGIEVLRSKKWAAMQQVHMFKKVNIENRKGMV